MRFALTICLGMLLASLPLLAQAQDAGSPEAEEYPTCFISGERWDTSSTRVEVIFVLDGKPVRGRFLNLAYMLMAIELFDQEGHDIETAEIQMLDYATFGSEHEQLIKVNDAGNNIWLWFTDEALDGSAAPYMAAFKTKEAAEELHRRSETASKVLSWDKALDKLIEALLADEE